MTWRKFSIPFSSSSLITATSCILVSVSFFSPSLQLAQNAAARLLTRSENRHHITEIRASQLRLPVSCRLKLKIFFFVYTALNVPFFLQRTPAPVPHCQTPQILRTNIPFDHRSRTTWCGYSSFPASAQTQ